MQEQQNRAASQPNIQEQDQDPDLVACVSLTHDIMETPLGKKWLAAMEKWYLVRMGTVDPRPSNWEAWAALREGQNSLIRQMAQWVKEHKAALQVKAQNATEGRTKAARKGKKRGA